MKPRKEVLAEGVDLWLGDCREILPTLGRVDVVVTDPPYDRYTHKRALTTPTDEIVAGIKDFGIEFAESSDLSFVTTLLKKTNTWLLFFCSLEMLGLYQEQASIHYVRGAIWDRIINAPQLSGDRPAQGGEGIAIFHGQRKNMKWNGGGHAAIFRHSVERGKKVHQTQKPLSLIQEITTLFTYKGETILDPFMGSGTTGVAAVMLDRKFIGIEIEPKYYDIARGRIENEIRSPSVFQVADRMTKKDKNRGGLFK